MLKVEQPHMKLMPANDVSHLCHLQAAASATLGFKTKHNLIASSIKCRLQNQICKSAYEESEFVGTCMAGWNGNPPSYDGTVFNVEIHWWKK